MRVEFMAPQKLKRDDDFRVEIEPGLHARECLGGTVALQESGGQMSGDRNGGHCDICVSLAMKLHHTLDIHSVNVVGPEDGHCAFVEVIDQVKVLEDCVRCPAVPALFSSLPFCRGWDDELVFQQTAELPTVTQVFQERLASVLNHHIDGNDP